MSIHCEHTLYQAQTLFTGLHVQKVYTSLGIPAQMRTPNPFVVCSCLHAYCLEIAISTKWGTHLGLIAIKMHICLSSQQNNMVYALGQDVPKLVYTF